MNTLLLLKSAGFAVSMFVACALLAAPNRTERGRYFLSIVCLQASLLFLKDIVEQSGGSQWLTTFLIFANFLFGLPSLFLFMRVMYGDPARRPLVHYLPSLVNLPAAAVVARGAIGSAGIDGAIPPHTGTAVFVPIFYINILALGETVQLVHYASASLRYLRPGENGARERIYAHFVLGVAACYAVYHAVRWIGFGIRIANARGGGFPPLSPWVNPASMVFLALFIGLAGIYIVTRPELLFGSRESRMKAKYGGKPLERAEAAVIVDSAAKLLSSCVDLSPDSMNPRRLARRLGVPYYLLSRVVNEHSGQTIADLIREKRVQRAKSLLNECPDATILRIALEAGFPAKSSFNDAFRKTVGISPSEYRRQQKRLDCSSH